MKNYVPLPAYEELAAKWLENYDAANYSDRGLAAQVLKRTHAVLERPYGPDRHFDQVLEVGAGTLAHLASIRHSFSRYIASDHDLKVVESNRKKPLPAGVELQQIVGERLPFANDSFDRLIATHVLEHIVNPHQALDEWVRVVKPGGVISLILPCDPGLAWRFGRNLGPRKAGEAAGLPYDYYMAREHVNSIFGLKQILRFHFPNRQETWWPMRVPFPDLNLIFCGNYQL